jgi:hypothetical protein
MTLEYLIGCLSNTWQAKFYSSGDYFGCLVVVDVVICRAVEYEMWCTTTHFCSGRSLVHGTVVQYWNTGK